MNINILSKKEIGAIGERLVKNYYQKSGYTFLSQNWRAGRNEIDLIFTKNNKLVFIEVKSQTFNYYNFKEIPLKQSQVKNIKKAILNFCFLNNYKAENCSLDLALVVFHRAEGLAKIRVYRDIM